MAVLSAKASGHMIELHEPTTMVLMRYTKDDRRLFSLALMCHQWLECVTHPHLPSSHLVARRATGLAIIGSKLFVIMHAMYGTYIQTLSSAPNQRSQLCNIYLARMPYNHSWLCPWLDAIYHNAYHTDIIRMRPRAADAHSLAVAMASPAWLLHTPHALQPTLPLQRLAAR
jgi:hypothetical protein